MADKSLSQLSEMTTLEADDLVAVSKNLGGGSYESQYIKRENLLVPLSNVLYVSKTGSDTEGDGDAHSPYLTINGALSNITDNGPTNSYTIAVAPGIYTETPIAMKNYVDIRAIAGPFTTTISASSASDTIVTSTGYNTLAGFSLTGATSGTAFLMATPGVPSSIVKDCVIYNCANGIECTSSSSVVVINLTTAPVGSVTNLIYANSGTIRGTGLVVPVACSITNVFHANGSTSKIDFVTFECVSTNVTTGIKCDDGATLTVRAGEIDGATDGVYILGTDSSLIISSMTIRNCTNAMRADGTGKITISSCEFRTSSSLDFLVESLDVEIHIIGLDANFGLAQFPAGYANEIVFIQDDFEGDEGFKFSGELAVGRPDRGSELIAGEGDSYTSGMVVLTTDSTASSTTDGGNFVDESEDASSSSGSTFSFQGTAANHTILIGSQRQTATDLVKHWGIKVKQTTAAVEVTPKSFVFEYWNGSAWTEFAVQSTESSEFYNYADEVFIRANSSEHIRFGLTEDVTGTDWTKKTIDSKNLYWTRIRIDTAVTTAPVFEQFKLSCNRFEANPDGTNTYHGRSRFRVSLNAAGNVFGESGGVAAWTTAIGLGTEPDGWTHQCPNSLLNDAGDAIYYQFSIPKGMDTSLPIFVDLTFLDTVNTGSGLDIDMTIGFKVVEVQGVLEADPSGGITPVARTLVNTESKTATAAQSDSVKVDDVDTTKIQFVEFGPFYISGYYPGDMVFIRFELDDLGTSSSQIGVVELGLSGVKWTHGGKL